ncbi:Methyltransferase domain-containing protein [Rutstroemia sp. NJR-2017a WRK4]|nr:Methyltransferase domain-containing protein [Rutstroemia sp. NJR-2017a WRK4]
MAIADEPAVQRRGSLSRDVCQSLHVQWATTYNNDFSNQAKGAILDPGCGTGFVGVHLVRSGVTSIDCFQNHH